MDILTIIFLPIHEYWMSFHSFLYSLIDFIHTSLSINKCQWYFYTGFVCFYCTELPNEFWQFLVFDMYHIIYEQRQSMHPLPHKMHFISFSYLIVIIRNVSAVLNRSIGNGGPCLFFWLKWKLSPCHSIASC